MSKRGVVEEEEEEVEEEREGGGGGTGGCGETGEGDWQRTTGV